MRYFETVFMEEVNEFVPKLEGKIAKKIFYNIDNAEQTNDPKLFKKLQNDVWEFRTTHSGVQVRLLAFWDKTNNTNTLVVRLTVLLKKLTKFQKEKLNEL